MPRKIPQILTVDDDAVTCELLCEVFTREGFGAEFANGAVRLSMGWSTTDADIDRCLEAWRKLAGTLLNSEGRNTA